MTTSRTEAKLSTMLDGSAVALHLPDTRVDVLNVHGQNIRPLATLSFKKNAKEKKAECNRLLDNARSSTLSRLLFSSPQDSSRTLINTHRRDTCFFQNDLSQLHFFPWETINVPTFASEESIKFSEIVIANCLFGANLRGVDDDGNKCSLIDHNLKVKAIISDIEVEQELHPYEIMAFACFDELAELMRSIAVEDFTVRYHLPVIDYMLYGLHSYISGIMSLAAFEKYVNAVEERGQRHKNILQNIAAKNGVKLVIESPFDGLRRSGGALSSAKLLGIIGLSAEQSRNFKLGIQQLADGEKKLSRLEKAFTHNGFDQHKFENLIQVLAIADDFLGSPRHGVYKPPTEDIRLLLEEICIENILRCLKNSDYNKHYSAIWRNIAEKELVSSFSPLEQLFKVANTTVIACAQEQNQSGAVCSLLPVDEKPIPTSYARFLAEHYGDIFCLSWLPPVFSYLNSPEDERSQKQSFLNNLFRLRTDLFDVDIGAFVEALTGALGLDGGFYQGLLQKESEALENRRPENRNPEENIADISTISLSGCKSAIHSVSASAFSPKILTCADCQKSGGLESPTKFV